MKYLKSKKGSLENSILNVWSEAASKVKEGSKEEYEKFFNSALKKFKIDSPADLKTDAKKKEFFNYVDKNYKAKEEETNLEEGKMKELAGRVANVVMKMKKDRDMKGFADNKSDGIIQFSTGAGQFASGLNHKNATKGTIILAEAAHALAEQYDILIGLNTDHCQPQVAESFLDPLIEATAARRAKGENNLFQNHMLDASILPLEENMAISQTYLKKCAEN